MSGVRPQGMSGVSDAAADPADRVTLDESVSMALPALLDPDAVCRGDGGGKVSALPTVVRGAERIARLVSAFVRDAPVDFRPVAVNGTASLMVAEPDGTVSTVSVVALTVDRQRATAVDVVRDPDKLTTVKGWI